MPYALKLTPTEVHTITLGVVNKASGVVEPVPAGDVITAESPNPAIEAVVGVDAAGAVALVVRALMLPDTGTASVVIPVKDSAGNVATELTVEYLVPPASGDLVLDMTGAAVTEQPMPPAPPRPDHSER